MANVLVGASMGLFTHNDRYYLQIISDEEYAFYHVELSVSEARAIASREDLEIQPFAQMPESMKLDKVHFQNY